MSVENLRTIEPSNSHRRYNAVGTGLAAEYARIGSVLIDHPRAVALLAYAIQSGLVDPTKCSGPKAVDAALKAAINAVREAAIVTLSAKQAKRSDTPTAADTSAANLIAAHFPNWK